MTEAKLIEKMARAMCLASCSGVEALFKVRWRDQGYAFTNDARAALAAIREALQEPTDDMREAFLRRWFLGENADPKDPWQIGMAGSVSDDVEQQFGPSYRAMLSASPLKGSEQ